MAFAGVHKERRRIAVSALFSAGEEKAQLMRRSFSFFHMHQPLPLLL